MIEIDIERSDQGARRRLERFEGAADALGDLLTDELVKAARRLAPVNLRSGINRRRVGKRWRVFARDDSAETYIEQAVVDFDWRGALRRLLNDVK
ncbi:MAG: hypothetical protein JXJ17_17115 [Anaerolineae bacterium]|nr:hypothetical protein [Anaerolineae bacterium]